ncbi:hypothetical protein WICMUC_004290 [Wickerhamomyces mucosus]|uniref:Uncharacterized protein n=1 Tax=Wickerhamomyces mucosus TaxID=1378264 RepID=A0A9P8TB52_9ASCO|nr:hypothetical protein WICMUC_004290 [Wickerhamomyces mucosus]
MESVIQSTASVDKNIPKSLNEPQQLSKQGIIFTDQRNTNTSTITTLQSTQLKYSKNRLPNDDVKITYPTNRFKFVNNSPTTMHKPRKRMKPTFKVDSTVSFHSLPQSNQFNHILNGRQSLMIEQRLEKSKSSPQPIDTNSNTDLDSGLDTTNKSQEQVKFSGERKYVFQLNVKRAPGRPRKLPLDSEINKVKRPQGRPRKNPIEDTSNTANKSTPNKKKKIIEDVIATGISVSQPTISHSNIVTEEEPVKSTRAATDLESGKVKNDKPRDPRSKAKSREIDDLVIADELKLADAEARAKEQSLNEQQVALNAVNVSDRQ